MGFCSLTQIYSCGTLKLDNILLAFFIDSYCVELYNYKMFKWIKLLTITLLLNNSLGFGANLVQALAAQDTNSNSGSQQTTLNANPSQNATLNGDNDDADLPNNTTATSEHATSSNLLDEPDEKNNQPKIDTDEVKSKTPNLTKQNKEISLLLVDAIALGLRNNPDVDKAYLQRINDKFTLKLAKGYFELNPSLTGSYSAPLNSPLSSSQTSSITPSVDLKTRFGTEFNFAWDNSFQSGFQSSTKTLTITQPLLKGLGADVNEISLKNAYDTEILNKLALKQTIISTVTGIISAYYTLQQSEMSLANDRIALKLAEKTVSDTEKKIKAGISPPSEIYQYQSQVANTNLTIQSDLDLLQQNQINLSNNLGIDPKTNIIVPIEIQTPKVIPNLDLSTQLAMMNDKNYLSDIINIRQAKRALLQSRDAARWQLNFVGTVTRTSYGHQAMQSGATPNLNAGSANDTAALSLTVPLGLTDLQNRAAIVSAQINYQEAMINLKNDRLKLMNSVMQGINTINIDIKKIQLAEEAVELQQKTLNIVTKKVRAGLSSGFELTTEQENLRTSKQALISAKIEYLNDLSSFDQTLGSTLDTWKIKVRY